MRASNNTAVCPACDVELDVQHPSAMGNARATQRCTNCARQWIPVKAAGLARRAIGGLVDAVIMSILGAAVMLGLAAVGVRSSMLRLESLDDLFRIGAAPLTDLVTECLPAFGAAFAYLALLVALRGQTVGMRLVRVAVVDGRRVTPSPVRASARALLQLAGLLIGGLTLAWVIIDRERRTLHDRLSATFAISTGGPA